MKINYTVYACWRINYAARPNARSVSPDRPVDLLQAVMYGVVSESSGTVIVTASVK